jgi:hypothetical protein
MEGTDPLDVHHLYRAMAVLEAHQEDIEQTLDVRLADLLNVAVALIFYETPSFPCDIAESDQGEGDDDLVEGRMAAGAKVYKAPRKRGMAKNGRSDVPRCGPGCFLAILWMAAPWPRLQTLCRGGN